MNIRTEKTSDYRAIEELTYLAFENHPHNEPGAKPTEHLLINNLRDNGVLTLSLVAQEENSIIGHIAFSPVTIAKKACDWYGLGPISVAPERQNEGIGGQLIITGLKKLKALGAMGVVLLGEPGYYGRFGFKVHADLTLPNIPPEYFLALSLNDEKTHLPVGTVTYHPAFG